MLDAVRQFSDPQVAHDFFVQIRFPNGVACPRHGCGSASVAYLEKYRRWYCNDCKKQFSAKVGTIFEDSPIGLDKWLPAIWLIASNRNGISSHALARALDVTQKTAWFMLHRIREAMVDKAFTKLVGPVEADETYIGGKPRRPSIGRQTLSSKKAPDGRKVRRMSRRDQSICNATSRSKSFGSTRVMRRTDLGSLLPRRVQMVSD